MANNDNKIKVNPVKSNVFGLAEHSYRRFNCTIDGDTVESAEDLQNPELWVNVASKLNIGDEIRVVADDMSFIAYLIVTFTRGNDVRTKLISGHELEDVVTEDNAPENEIYDVKHKGAGKYIVIDTRDGSTVLAGPFSKSDAIRQRDDYIKALLR